MEEIAEVYARSLFDVASQQGHMDELREQLGQFADALEGDRDLQVFFFSPYFSSQEKKDGLHRMIEGADPALMNFLELLVEKHRMPVIFRIRRVYEKLWEKRNRVLAVEISTAIALDDEVVRKLGDRISQSTGQRIELTANVEPQIIGGIVLRVGNSILDASIRNRLDTVRRRVASGSA